DLAVEANRGKRVQLLRQRLPGPPAILPGAVDVDAAGGVERVEPAERVDLAAQLDRGEVRPHSVQRRLARPAVVRDVVGKDLPSVDRLVLWVAVSAYH